MLEKEIRRRIYNQLKAMNESNGYDIQSLCEYRSTIREILMLYYCDHREDLKDEE